MSIQILTFEKLIIFNIEYTNIKLKKKNNKICKIKNLKDKRNDKIFKLKHSEINILINSLVLK